MDLWEKKVFDDIFNGNFPEDYKKIRILDLAVSAAIASVSSFDMRAEIEKNYELMIKLTEKKI